MAKRVRTKGQQVAQATQFVAGIGKHFAGAAPLTFASAAHTPQQLLTAFEAFIGLRAAVEAARCALKARLVSEGAQAPAILVLMDGFEAFVRLTFSEQPEILGDFGLAPRKARKPLTAEQQAAAAAKRLATRKARGTLGPVQKKQVKGNVVGVVVTPVTAVIEPGSNGT
jgi:hypothetical protein